MACFCRKRKNIYYINDEYATSASGRYRASTNYKQDGSVTERTPQTTQLSTINPVPRTNVTGHGNSTTNAKVNGLGTGADSMVGSQVAMKPTVNGDSHDYVDGSRGLHHAEDISLPRRTREATEGTVIPTGAVARRDHLEPLTEKQVDSDIKVKQNESKPREEIVSHTSISITSIEKNAPTTIIATSTPNVDSAAAEVFTESAVISALKSPRSNTSDQTSSESTITNTTVTTIARDYSTLDSLVEEPEIQIGEADDAEVVHKVVYTRSNSSSSAFSSESEQAGHFEVTNEEHDASEIDGSMNDEQDAITKTEETMVTTVTIGDADAEYGERDAVGYSVINGDNIDTFMVRSDRTASPPEENSDASSYDSADYDQVAPPGTPVTTTEDEDIKTEKTTTTTEKNYENWDSSKTITKVTTTVSEQLADSNEIYLNEQTIDYVHT